MKSREVTSRSLALASPNLGAGDRGLDMIDQRIGQAEASGEEIEIAALRPAVRLDGDAGGGIELDLLALGLGRADDAVEIDGIGEFMLQEGFGIGPQAGEPDLAEDRLALGIVDMAVGTGGRDHGA